MPGPEAVRLLREARAAGFKYLPNQQQMDYFFLADQPLDGSELLQLYTSHLAPLIATRHTGSMGSRSGAGREAEAFKAMGHSRVQQVCPSLAPGFDNLIAALSEQQQQQLQQPAQKKRKVSSRSTTAAVAAVAAAIEPMDAAKRLLLALRSLVRWWSKGQQEQQLPLLMQLLLFGHPAADVEGVVECIDLVSDGEDESLNRQLMQGEEEVIVTREVQPREQRQRWGGRECCWLRWKQWQRLRQGEYQAGAVVRWQGGRTAVPIG
jgi:hypothetical protein